MADTPAHGPQVQRVLDSLAPEIAEFLETLLREPASGRERLHRDVDGYLLWMEGSDDCSREAEEVARVLARRCHVLIDRVGAGHQDPQRLVQAGVRYFVADQDATPDDGGMSGFDDDAAVLDAIEKVLGSAD